MSVMSQEVLDLCAQHGIAPEIETIDMADIEQASARTRNEDVRFRHVVDMATLSRRAAELADAPMIGVLQRGAVVGRAA